MSEELNKETLCSSENIKEIQTEKLVYTPPLLNIVDISETAGGAFNLQESDGMGLVS